MIPGSRHPRPRPPGCHRGYQAARILPPCSDRSDEEMKACAKWQAFRVFLRSPKRSTGISYARTTRRESERPVNRQFVILGNAQGVEVSAELRLFPSHRLIAHAPHIASRTNDDMRRTLDHRKRQTGGVSGVPPALQRHARGLCGTRAADNRHTTGMFRRQNRDLEGCCRHTRTCLIV